MLEFITGILVYLVVYLGTGSAVLGVIIALLVALIFLD